jgi:hypothetical protein
MGVEMPYPGYTTEEVARRGRKIYEHRIRRNVEPEQEGKCIVIDITASDYEIAQDDLEAPDRMVERNPDAMLYGTRIGQRAAYRTGSHLAPSC